MVKCVLTLLSCPIPNILGHPVNQNNATICCFFFQVKSTFESTFRMKVGKKLSFCSSLKKYILTLDQLRTHSFATPITIVLVLKSACKIFSCSSTCALQSNKCDLSHVIRETGVENGFSKELVYYSKDRQTINRFSTE